MLLVILSLACSPAALLLRQPADTGETAAVDSGEETESASDTSEDTSVETGSDTAVDTGADSDDTAVDSGDTAMDTGEDTAVDSGDTDTAPPVWTCDPSADPTFAQLDVWCDGTNLHVSWALNGVPGNLWYSFTGSPQCDGCQSTNWWATVSDPADACCTQDIDDASLLQCAKFEYMGTVFTTPVDDPYADVDCRAFSTRADGFSYYESDACPAYAGAFGDPTTCAE